VGDYLDKKIQEIKNKLREGFTDPKFKNDVLTLLLQGKRERDLATEMIVNKFLERYYVHTIRDDKLTEMWIYEEGVYRPEGKSYVKEFCRDVLGDAYDTHLVNKIIAKIEVDTFIDMASFFIVGDPWELAVGNGILNLKTRELKPFDPERIFFNKIPVNYDPDAKIEKIDQFLRDVLETTDIPVIQELFGFCLVREYFLEHAFMFLGSGANGKTRLLHLLERFLGAENCVGVPLQQLITDHFAMGELQNKMVNLTAEVSDKTLDETGLFKQVTGKDPISANRKFKTRLKFTNYAKLINACNELPRTRDFSYGFFRRWILIEFKNRFINAKEIGFMMDEERKRTKEADPNIVDKISNPQELSGLLNFALEGLKRIVVNGRFSYSITTNEVKNRWLRLSNSFEGFFVDRLKMDVSGTTHKSKIRESYYDYCMKYKLKPVNDRIIKQTMEDKGCWDERPAIAGERVLVWRGVVLRDKQQSVLLQ